MKETHLFFFAGGLFMLAGVIQIAFSNTGTGAAFLPIGAAFFAIGASKNKPEDGDNAR